MLAAPKTVHPPFLKLDNREKKALFVYEFDKYHQYKINIECYSGEFYRLKFPGVTAFAQAPSIKENIVRILPLIGEINRNLPQNSRTNLLVFYSAPGVFMTELSYNKEFRCIYGFEEALEFSDYSRPAIFHEQAHAAYWHLVVPSQENLVSLNQLYRRFHAALFVPYDKCALVQMLSENSYANIRDYNELFGHPYTNLNENFASNELFASTSTILRFFHLEFFGRLARKDKDVSGLLYEIAAGVVQAWGSAKIFADEVYWKLGLPVPAGKESLLLKERRNI
ncbi:MAG: hypothetical protein WCT52_01895 [Candidatus Micrarchaeia archaeon]